MIQNRTSSFVADAVRFKTRSHFKNVLNGPMCKPNGIKLHFVGSSLPEGIFWQILFQSKYYQGEEKCYHWPSTPCVSLYSSNFIFL